MSFSNWVTDASQHVIYYVLAFEDTELPPTINLLIGVRRSPPSSENPVYTARTKWPDGEDSGTFKARLLEESSQWGGLITNELASSIAELCADQKQKLDPIVCRILRN